MGEQLDSSGGTGSEPGPAPRLLRRLVDVREGEGAPLAWSFGYFFFLLAAYYVLRPLREEMGIRAGVENLPWLFTATFLTMLAAVPFYGWAVTRWPRRVFIPAVYRFFALNLVVFFLLLEFLPATGQSFFMKVYFVWLTVFNLFAVSVFWSTMADLFSNDQGRRLFGFLSAGGNVGALFGSELVVRLAGPVGIFPMLLVSAVFLELCVRCFRGLDRRPHGHGDAVPLLEDRPMGGGVLEGIALVVRSPYLLGISLYLLIQTFTSTTLYFEVQHIVAANIEDSAERLIFFARINFFTTLVAILVGWLLTARVISGIGVGATLMVLPVMILIGLLGLGWAPSLTMIFALQVIGRGTNFGLSKPTREILYTVVGRREKYKAKGFIDTVLFRGGDFVAGWAFQGLLALGLTFSGIAFVVAPLAGVWAMIGRNLGRAQERLRAGG